MINICMYVVYTPFSSSWLPQAVLLLAHHPLPLPPLLIKHHIPIYMYIIKKIQRERETEKKERERERKRVLFGIQLFDHKFFFQKIIILIKVHFALQIDSRLPSSSALDFSPLRPNPVKTL